VELIRASLEPYLAWIEEMVGVPLDQTLTLEVDADPGDAVAERLLEGLPLSAGTKSRNRFLGLHFIKCGVDKVTPRMPMACCWRTLEASRILTCSRTSLGGPPGCN